MTYQPTISKEENLATLEIYKFRKKEKGAKTLNPLFVVLSTVKRISRQ